MNEHPIQGIMDTTMQKIKEMIDVNTIIGTPITTPDGVTIIPVSKVSFGFASGGSDHSSDKTKNPEKMPFGGGSGAGVTINPITFLVVKGDNVRLLPVSASESSVDKLIDLIPEAIDKITNKFSKKDSAENAVKTN